MKIRNGFVSNSSSSSYIIALKKGNNKVDYKQVIKFVLKYNNKCESKIFNGSFTEKVNLVKEEIKDNQKNIEWIKKEQELYEEILLNKKSLRLFVRVMNGRIEAFFENLTEKEIMVNREYRDRYLDPIKFIKEKIKYFGVMTKKIKNDIIELNNLLELYNKYNNKSYELVEFEDDLNWGFLGPMFEELIKEKEAILIKKETT